jgi:uncharacterized membrane protein YfcA
LPGAFVGLLIGALTFRWLNADAVRLIIGLVAVLFTLQHWFAIGPKRADGKPPGPSYIKGGAWGTLSGFTSFVAHAGGPPLQFYMLPQKIDKTLYVGTTVWFFLAVNYVKLVPYTMLGLFSAENLGTSLILLPLAPLGVWAGVKLHTLVSQQLFYRIAYMLLMATGLKLCWDGVSGLL